jgi:hypothetical protein
MATAVFYGLRNETVVYLKYLPFQLRELNIMRITTEDNKLVEVRTKETFEEYRIGRVLQS